MSSTSRQKWLSKSGREPVVKDRLQGMTIDALADQFGVYKTKIPRIVKGYEHEGDAAYLPVPGRPRITKRPIARTIPRVARATIASPQSTSRQKFVETLFSNKTMIPSTLPVMRLTGSNGVRLNPWNG
ncbi:hypothetical protein Aduo_009459 [Ancylostoma duodenale]